MANPKLALKFVGWLELAVGANIGLFTRSYGVPGWALALIAISYFASLAVNARYLKLARRPAETTAAPPQCIRKADLFGVDVLYDRRTVGDRNPRMRLLCRKPDCRIELRWDLGDHWKRSWSCGICGAHYPDVPDSLQKVGTHIRADLRRGAKHPRVDGFT